MTIARDIENVTDNWSGWAVWNWWIFRWITNESNTADTLWCSDLPFVYVYEAWSDAETLSSNRGTDCIKKRQLKLSNWEIIWDLGWNAWEHVNGKNTLDWTDYNTLDGNMCLWGENYYSWYGNDWAWWWTCNYQTPYTKLLYWPSWDYNGINWIWRIKSSSWTDKAFRRGGGGGLDLYTGIYALDMGIIDTTTRTDTGFRCAR